MSNHTLDLLLSFYRELRCLRNNIHTNLMVSYILTDLTWILTTVMQVNNLIVTSCHALLNCPEKEASDMLLFDKCRLHKTVLCYIFAMHVAQYIYILGVLINNAILHKENYCIYWSGCKRLSFYFVYDFKSIMACNILNFEFRMHLEIIKNYIFF